MSDFPEFAYSPLVSRLHHFGVLDDDETKLLDDLPFEEALYEKGQSIISRGEYADKVLIVTSGWAARSCYTLEGQRQIIHVLLPGDILTPDVFILKSVDHDIEALSIVTVRSVDMSDLKDLFAKAPTLATALWWSSAHESSIIRRHVVQLGRKTAIQRVAHFILELHGRLLSVDQASEDAMIIPISQQVISDALGLTFVTVSRTLKTLTQEGYLDKSNTILRLINTEGLAEFCDFELEYQREKAQKIA